MVRSVLCGFILAIVCAAMVRVRPSEAREPQLEGGEC
jgi:hypothetical protein